MSKERTALVLGASGGAGGAVASKLREAGWTVKALRRVQDQHSMIHEGTTWVRGDAMNAADVARAARGVSVIVHAVNPPGYKRWDELVLPMIDNTIAAAVAEKATIVLPGTVYNFGADALPLVAEDALQRPSTRKGAIRVELERRIEAATRQDARALIVRAGDFFGPNSTSNWFAQGIVKAGSPVRKVSLLGDAGVGHQWAYLPDFALTVAKLLARRDTLEPFARFHFGGHWDADGTRMGEAVRRAVGQSTGIEPVLRPFPWWLVRLSAPVSTTMFEMREMRYLWREEVRLDNRKLQALLGNEPHTPIDAAVTETLMGLRCLPGPTAAFPAHP